MNAFETWDRYDTAIALLSGLVMVGALALGAPLWAAVPIMFAGCVVMFIRDFDKIMWPDGRESHHPAPTVRESRPEQIVTPGK